MKKIYSIILAVTALCFVANAQSVSNFALEEKNGHLYFSAEIAEEQVDIMLESGIPAFLIDRNFYEQKLKNDLNLDPSTAKIRLLNNQYDIIFKGSGKLKVGDMLYDGPIFILDNFGDARIPIQNLRNQQGEKTPICINLQQGLLSVGQSATENTGKSYRIRTDKDMGFMVVTAPISIHTDGATYQIKDDLIVDFGNPTLLFLMKKHKKIAKAIDKCLTLKDAYNQEGVLVAQGIFAEEITICGRTYKDVSIGVTDKMPFIKQLGFLGIPFFGSYTVFDFAKETMTIIE